MPIIKSAKKRVRQDKKKTIRNSKTKSMMKTSMKKVLEDVKNSDLEAATKNLQVAYKLIDTAAKKNIVHKKNAAHKKSKIARAVNTLAVSGAKKEKAEK